MDHRTRSRRPKHQGLSVHLQSSVSNNSEINKKTISKKKKHTHTHRQEKSGTIKLTRDASPFSTPLCPSSTNHHSVHYPGDDVRFGCVLQEELQGGSDDANAEALVQPHRVDGDESDKHNRVFVGFQLVANVDLIGRLV